MKTICLDDEAMAEKPAADKQRNDGTHEILPDLAYKRLGIVNVVFYGQEQAADWVLIDAGLPGTAAEIRRAAAARFGEGSRPAAIIMTHAHADHAGALEALAEEWNTPIYAHQLEAPYLNGTASYPPPDPRVGGGLMPILSVLFPRGPFNVSRWLKPLPADGSIPAMPGWRWIHTPGHTPGHVSLWRESDRNLIAGDAFVTTRQESVYAAVTQKPEMHGPPMYYTQNFDEAEASVKRLDSLNPEIVVTGHGRAMRGESMRRALHELALEFREVAVPNRGKYVEHPKHSGSPEAYVTKRS